MLVLASIQATTVSVLIVNSWEKIGCVSVQLNLLLSVSLLLTKTNHRS